MFLEEDPDEQRYLPPQPERSVRPPRFSSYLRLIALDETDPACAAIHLPAQTQADTAQRCEMLLSKKWENLSTEEWTFLVTQAQIIWQEHPQAERNLLVTEALAEYPSNGTPLPWCTSLHLALKVLVRRVQNDFFSDVFSDILYYHLSRSCGMDQEALSDPYSRAIHFLTLLASTDAEIICFAFVLAYRPLSIFKRDTPVPLPLPTPQSLLPSRSVAAI